MEYENEFFDGPLADSILKTTVPIGQIVIETERTEKIKGMPASKVIPVARHVYEWDYQESVEPSVTHRRFCLSEHERDEV